MQVFVDVLNIYKMTMDRVQVEITTVHSDGSFDCRGGIHVFQQVTIPVYDANGVIVTPVTD